MVDRGYGRIVNITSIHARFGEELALSYDVAKGGLDQATRTLAIELSRYGVLVNAVAPGFVSTRMSVVDGVNELESDWFRTVYLQHGKLPLRRYAEPPDIAAQVAWLASDRNTYVTGHVLTVDGGVTVTF
jgi:NAD(P)-dependent dehydrogenase (short-subunit alcohol dehydrogenase family)